MSGVVYFIKTVTPFHDQSCRTEIASNCSSDLFLYHSVEGGIEGVAVGAILSDYQRVRVENVCARCVYVVS